MTIEQAKRASQLIRQVRETFKTAIDEVSDIAENALTIFIDDGVPSRKKLSSGNKEKRLLNKVELAKRLGVCSRTVSDLLNEGMPFVQIKTRIQFDYDDVVIWLKSQTANQDRKNNLRVVK